MQVPTVQTLHLGLLALRALLQPLGVPPLLAVEHQSQHHDDVGHGRPHRQADGLNHLVRSPVFIDVVGVCRLLCWAKKSDGSVKTKRSKEPFKQLNVGISDASSRCPLIHRSYTQTSEKPDLPTTYS